LATQRRVQAVANEIDLTVGHLHAIALHIRRLLRTARAQIGTRVRAGTSVERSAQALVELRCAGVLRAHFPCGKAGGAFRGLAAGLDACAVAGARLGARHVGGARAAAVIAPGVARPVACLQLRRAARLDTARVGRAVGRRSSAGAAGAAGNAAGSAPAAAAAGSGRIAVALRRSAAAEHCESPANKPCHNASVGHGRPPPNRVALSSCRRILTTRANCPHRNRPLLIWVFLLERARRRMEASVPRTMSSCKSRTDGDERRPPPRHPRKIASVSATFSATDAQACRLSRAAASGQRRRQRK